MAQVKVTPGQTWNARALARLIGDMFPGIRAYDARDVRGLARGDNGPAVIERYADSPADGGNRSHVYTLDDARLIIAAVVARHLRRTGVTLTVPAPFGVEAVKRSRKPRKPRAAVKPVARSAGTGTVTPTVTDAPSA